MLLPADVLSPYRQDLSISHEGIRSYQTAGLLSPIWPIDSAYGTVPTPVLLSIARRKGRFKSIKDSGQTEGLDVIDDDDVVIPLSGVVSPKMIEDDKLTERQIDVSEVLHPLRILLGQSVELA